MPTGSFGFAVVNSDTGGTPARVQVKLSDLALNHPAGYNITEVFDNKSLGVFKFSDTFTFYVNPTGVFFGKAIPLN